MNAVFKILKAIAEADDDDRVSEIKVDVPLGGYPRSYLRAAVKHVLATTASAGWCCVTCGVGFDTARELAAHNCLGERNRAAPHVPVRTPQGGKGDGLTKRESDGLIPSCSS